MSKVIVDGVEWQEFLIEFQTQEGTFNFKLFAVDWAHAIDRLEELKATAKVVGDNCSEVPAAPVQEPVAWRWVPSKVWQDYVLSDDPQKAALAQEHGIEVEALCKCATPPAAQRQWVGLTADEMLEALISVDPATKRLPIGFARFARAIEAKLRSKNGGQA